MVYDYGMFREFMFWGIWLVIPLMIDVISGIFGTIVVLNKHCRKETIELDYLPHVNILIPVYNSRSTLKSCLNSILEQNYPINKMTVLLINNGEKHNSYDLYCDFQEHNPYLKIWWIDSSKGKAKALNKGIYMSEGKYIINIDSDGILDKNAVLRVVQKFEVNPDIGAMTGVVMIDHHLIKKTKHFTMRMIQQCEFFEYLEAFMVGRGFQSASNTIFTLAGAFSCYRKDVLLKTQLYNNETLGEDTHMTSQIREFLGCKIALCEDAYFYVDPVENLDKLYIQRQRWQRGQMEVSSLFLNGLNKRKHRVFNVLNYSILKDHTLAFPRFIWIFASVYLIFLGYPLSLIMGANIIMYFVYVFSSFIYYLAVKLYLKDMKQDRAYMDKHMYTIFLLPLYRFVVFLMRVAGIVNSTERNGAWNTRTFTEEIEFIRNKLRNKFKYFYVIKEWVNNG